MFESMAALHAPGVGLQIEGEVYEVDSRMLETLDELEGVNSEPQLFIRRDAIEVELENGKTKWVIMYLLPYYSTDRLKPNHPEAYQYFDKVPPEMVKARKQAGDVWKNCKQPIATYIVAVVGGEVAVNAFLKEET